jgi:hypothetical protein
MESFNKKNNQQEATNYSLQAIKLLNPQIKSLDCDTDGLLDFEVQTTLEAFQTKKR